MATETPNPVAANPTPTATDTADCFSNDLVGKLSSDLDLTAAYNVANTKYKIVVSKHRKALNRFNAYETQYEEFHNNIYLVHLTHFKALCTQLLMLNHLHNTLDTQAPGRYEEMTQPTLPSGLPFSEVLAEITPHATALHAVEESSNTLYLMIVRLKRMAKRTKEAEEAVNKRLERCEEINKEWEKVVMDARRSALAGGTNAVKHEGGA